MSHQRKETHSPLPLTLFSRREFLKHIPKNAARLALLAELMKLGLISGSEPQIPDWLLSWRQLESTPIPEPIKPFSGWTEQNRPQPPSPECLFEIDIQPSKAIFSVKAAPEISNEVNCLQNILDWIAFRYGDNYPERILEIQLSPKPFYLQQKPLVLDHRHHNMEIHGHLGPNLSQSTRLEAQAQSRAIIINGASDEQSPFKIGVANLIINQGSTAHRLGLPSLQHHPDWNFLPWSYLDGGGIMICGNAETKLESLIFNRCTSLICGGAISIDTAGVQTPLASIENCQFVGCDLIPSGIGTGVGIDVLSGSALISNPTFVNCGLNYKKILPHHEAGLIGIFADSRVEVNGTVVVHAQAPSPSLIAANQAGSGWLSLRPQELQLAPDQALLRQFGQAELGYKAIISNMLKGQSAIAQALNSYQVRMIVAQARDNPGVRAGDRTINWNQAQLPPVDLTQISYPGIELPIYVNLEALEAMR